MTHDRQTESTVVGPSPAGLVELYRDGFAAASEGKGFGDRPATCGTVLEVDAWQRGYIANLDAVHRFHREANRRGFALARNA